MSYPTIISYSNHGYIDFAKNLLINLSMNVKNHKIHFYCLDNETFNELNSLSLKCDNVTFDKLYLNTSSNFEVYGSLQYNKITHTKTTVLKDALNKFNFIHFIDCDVVCKKEPTIEHYNKYKDYDIVFQHDAGFYSKERMHAPTLNHIWACTGNTTLRNTVGTNNLLNIIETYQTKFPNKNDQECLYQYFQDCFITDMSDYKETKLYTYKPDEYTNGFWFNNNIGTLENTYFFHANHVSGKLNKINLLKKANEWYV